MRSRCRSCRTMWRFQTAAGARGSQGAPGPAMAAESLAAEQSSGPSGGAEPPGDSMTSGRQRRGIPGLYQALLSGRSGSQSRCCGGRAKTFSPKGARFCPRGKQRGSQPPRRLWVRPGRGLGVAFLNLPGPGPVSQAEDAGRSEFPEEETLPSPPTPTPGCTGTSTKHKQSLPEGAPLSPTW